MQGDAKVELCEFLDENHIDLLIMGFSATNRIRKALTGGSLSSHMLHHAPCPIVVLPLKSMAWEDQDTLGNLPELRPSISGGAFLPDFSSLTPLGLHEPCSNTESSKFFQYAGVDLQISPTNTEGNSPPAMTSLGPRVSLSKLLITPLASPLQEGFCCFSTRAGMPGLWM